MKKTRVKLLNTTPDLADDMLLSFGKKYSVYRKVWKIQARKRKNTILLKIKNEELDWVKVPAEPTIKGFYITNYLHENYVEAIIVFRYSAIDILLLSFTAWLFFLNAFFPVLLAINGIWSWSISLGILTTASMIFSGVVVGTWCVETRKKDVMRTEVLYELLHKHFVVE